MTFSALFPANRRRSACARLTTAKRPASCRDGKQRRGRISAAGAAAMMRAGSSTFQLARYGGACLALSAMGAAMSKPAYSDDPAKERDFQLFYAGVLEREAQAREAFSPGFAANLRAWAAKARDRAASIDTRPAQGDLFG